jgi:hypothetical protein
MGLLQGLQLALGGRQQGVHIVVVQQDVVDVALAQL